MHTLLAQTTQFVGHGIPLYLLAFGILYLVLAFVVRPLGGQLHLGIASLTIAAALAWFVVDGAFGGFNGTFFLAPDVTTVLGVGLVLLVLGKIFGGH